MPPPLPPRRQTSKDLKSSQKIPSSNNSAPAVNRTVVKDNEDGLRKSSSLSIFNRSSSQCYPETSSALKTVAPSITHPISQDSNQNNRTIKSSVENNPIQQLFSAFSRKPKQASEPNVTGNKQKRPSSDKSKNLLRAKKTASDEDLRYRKSKQSSEGNRQIRGPPTNYEKRRSANEANALKPTYRRSYSDDPRNILVVSKFNVNNQRSADPHVKNSAPSNLPCSDLSPVPECVRANNYMVKSVPDEVRSVRASKATPTLGNARSNASKVASTATSRGVRVSKSSPEVTRSTRVTKPTVGYTKTVVKNPTKAKNNVIRGLFGSENLHNKTLKNNTAVVVALNHNNNIVLTPVSSKRATYPDSTNVTLRRGQAQGASASKASNGNALRGASSVTSLDSKHKVAPLNSGKLVKANSKEKIDKPIAPPIPPQKNERSKNESKNNKTNNIAAALKNNNRIDLKEPIITNGDTKGREVIGPVSLPGTLEASDAELAMQELASVQQELELVTREKATLALELSTYQGELQSLRTELTRLQSYQDQHSSEMDHLVEENAVLRSRLMEVAHSPLSDNEKQQLLLDTQRQHNSAPASFSTNEMGDISTPHLNGAQPSGEMTSSCPTPDWDKHSSSSMSEVSVACLQDRILQMEETHYSTNEELQATLQELADLQTQLLELQVDNERLRDEKTVLLESLCQQTEKLEDSRAAVGTLRELLIRSGGGGSQPEDAALDDAQIREQKLVDLLKAAQEEREALLSKHEELMNELHTLRQSATVQVEEREQLVDRVRLLETTVDSVHAERKLIDEELAKAKEQSSARRIEISQLSTLLDNARSKIDELEKERDKGDRSEMDALLDSARKEKDTLESQVAELQGEVSRGQCEKERLKEQLSTLQEECKVAKNNAKTVISDIEYQLSEAKREISNLKAELQTSHNALLEVQAQVQRHLEDKRGLKAVLAETQRSLADMERRLTETEEKLRDEEDRREKENEEWEQFRRDLLMTVRVANDFKTEAQSEREKLVLENKMLKDRARALETQLEKLKAVKTPSPTLIRQSSVPVETQNSLLTSVQQEMAARRQKVGSVRQENPLSVKSLIESIENATKQVKAGPGGSHNSSTSSLNSIASDIRTPSTAPSNGGSLSVPVSAGNGDWTERTAKSPLREQQQSVAPIVNKTQRSPSNKNLITDVGYGNKTDGKPEDSIRESVAILSAKSIDFVRRNSYGDLSERKDPLNGLVKNGGSKRNALLKWCQQKTVGYRNIDITNFSSSWNDGLALCALLHTYLPDRIPYDTLVPTEKRRNFSLAFAAAESVGIPTTLNINDMCQLERPDWQQVMGYVTAIYKHFET